MIAWMFPGQGSQKPGMGLDIEGASELFKASRSVVNRDLERLCTTDPDPAWAPDVLQPAMFVTEVAIGRKMQSLGLEPEAVIGHSLGEFPALVIAGAVGVRRGPSPGRPAAARQWPMPEAPQRGRHGGSDRAGPATPSPASAPGRATSGSPTTTHPSRP